MEMNYSELDNGIGLIKLNGELDIIGVGKIETKFTGYCAGENIRIIVDLSEVNFLASIGIRLLVLTAKSIVSRNGKMVLLNPTPEVHSILEITGIPSIIPIYSQLESAETVLMAP
jgi:anti-sigma B factor antagonist